MENQHGVFQSVVGPPRAPSFLNIFSQLVLTMLVEGAVRNLPWGVVGCRPWPKTRIISTLCQIIQSESAWQEAKHILRELKARPCVGECPVCWPQDCFSAGGDVVLLASSTLDLERTWRCDSWIASFGLVAASSKVDLRAVNQRSQCGLCSSSQLSIYDFGRYKWVHPCSLSRFLFLASSVIVPFTLFSSCHNVRRLLLSSSCPALVQIFIANRKFATLANVSL